MYTCKPTEEQQQKKKIMYALLVLATYCKQ